MFIFKFEPILKQMLWGGDKIIPFKQISSPLRGVGESWELSGVKGCESVVSEGEYAGCKLPELIAALGAGLLGRDNYERFGNEFPLLIKFIDARADLSIQVHPDDKLAAKRHNSRGKTEMWYVVDADDGATLRSGFVRQIDAQEYERHVAENTITDVLTKYDIHVGDLFFMPAGRVHSIGAGAFIAEIQQTSDITYRIYDFDRRDADGRPRELHTELAKDAIDYTVLPDYRTRYEDTLDSEVPLVSCPCFTTSLYRLTRSHICDYSSLDSFVAMIFVGGSGTIKDNTGDVTGVNRGETVLIPASATSVEVIPDAGCELKFLTSCIV